MNCYEKVLCRSSYFVYYNKFKHTKGIIMEYREDIELPVDINTAIWICREAIAEVNWRVFANKSNYILCKELFPQITSCIWPVQIEITMSSLGKCKSKILLSGSIFGLGPIQYGHLRGQVGNLHNRILVCWHRSNPASDVDI